MNGGIMQLVAYGAQDIYLTGNHNLTYFKGNYKPNKYKVISKGLKGYAIRILTKEGYATFTWDCGYNKIKIKVVENVFENFNPILISDNQEDLSLLL